jgi:hypothetical protein
MSAVMTQRPGGPGNVEKTHTDGSKTRLLTLSPKDWLDAHFF